MTDFDFTGYMRNIAIQLKDIGHIENDEDNKRFYRVSSLDKMDEILQNLSILKEFVLVVEDNAEGIIVDANCLMDRSVCNLYLLKKAELNSAADHEAVKNACKSAMKKILARMYRDYLNSNSDGTDLGLRNVDFSSWRYNTFGPVLNNCFGINVVFSADNGLNEVFNASDWNN